MISWLHHCGARIMRSIMMWIVLVSADDIAVTLDTGFRAGKCRFTYWFLPLKILTFRQEDDQ